MEGSPVNENQSINHPSTEIDALLAEIGKEKMEEDNEGEIFMTEMGHVMGPQIISILNDRAIKNVFTK